MADVGGIQPVGAMVQSPNVLGTLNDILGLQQKQQALQYQGQQVQQAEIETDRQKRFQSFATNFDWHNYQTSDGTVDVDAVHDSPIYKNAGMAKPAVDDYLMGMKGKQLKVKSDLLKLSGEQLDRISTTAGSILNDDDVKQGTQNGVAKARAAVDSLGDQLGPGTEEIVQGFKDGLTHLKQPGDLPKLIQSLQSMTKSGQEQMAVRKAQPTAIQEPGGIQFRNTNPYATEGVGAAMGSPITQGVAPEVRDTPGGLGIVSPAGSLRRVAAPGDTTPPAPPGKLQPIPSLGMNPTKVQQETYQKNIADARDHFSQVTAAATDPYKGVGAMRSRNDEIMRLTDKAMTGKGHEVLAKVGSFFGVGGTDFQTMAHKLAYSSSSLASQMGVPGTNLGQEHADALAGNTSQNPATIREATRTNDAMNTALAMYDQGLARLSHNGSDVSKIPAFRQTWTQNFDANVFRLEDSHRRQDTEERDRLNNTLGPAGMKELLRKRDILKSLTDTGDMP